MGQTTAELAIASQAAFLVGGALIAGIVGLVSSAINRWRERLSGKRELATALLAELEVLSLDDVDAHEEFYQPIFDSLKVGGLKHSAELLTKMFSEDPTDLAPVFYASAAEIGILGAEVSAKLVKYYTLRAALMRTALLIVANQDTLGDQHLELAVNGMEARYNLMREAKQDSIAGLQSISGSK